MRRGHPGSVWRNENTRNFRPRGGGMPHFRPPRGYGHIETPRYQPPGPRSFLGPPTPFRHNAPGNDPLEHQSYSGNQQNSQRRPDRGKYSHQGQRQILPFLQRMRQDTPDRKSYQEPAYYDNKIIWETSNTMGDVDHRRPLPPKQNSYSQHISPWVNPPFGYNDRSPNKTYRYRDSDSKKISQQDCAGHRPPASDHYEGHQGSTMDNSNTFSRSVDDTVDIIRRRLLNRDSQSSSDIQTPNEMTHEAEASSEPVSNKYLHVQPEQQTKRKSHKIKNMKSNCDKIKNKIVHQLFMMDKDKIHKLMDNPNSSSKFEYAISSLVTESQNSFNRHLRSMAEKSLCTSSSSEIIQQDNNTIYEDTFMKHMQCILDPQDTVLLEDIKPMVLAELSKVLQLDDLQLRQEDDAAYSREDQFQNDQYPIEGGDNYDKYDPCSPYTEHDTYEQMLVSGIENVVSPGYTHEGDADFSNNQQEFDSKPLFERRKPRRNSDLRYRKSSMERSQSIEEGQRPNTERQRSSLESQLSSEEGRRPNTERQRSSLESQLSSEEGQRPNTERQRSSLESQLSSAETQRSSLENQMSSAERRRSSLKQRASAERLRSSAEMLRKSIDISSEDNANQNTMSVPLFDSNTEHFSDDEDPFAEFDRQYHVAVDHNFIENEYICSPTPSNKSNRALSPPIINNEDPLFPVAKKETSTSLQTPEKRKLISLKPALTIKPEIPPSKIKEEIDSQLKNMAKSPLNFLSPTSKSEPETPTKQEELQFLETVVAQKSPVDKNSNNMPTNREERVHGDASANISLKEECPSEQQDAAITPVKSERSNSLIKTSTQVNSRKRANDQKPSHRKEKRKKSESNEQKNSSKQILNKNIIIHVSDCAKTSDKSIFNLFFSKDNAKEPLKDKKVESTDKKCSDKYVKRKAKDSSNSSSTSSKMHKDKEFDTKKKPDSSLSNHSILSPTHKEESNQSHTPNKADTQSKLKPINMFGDQQKKSTSVHQAQRNKAAPVVTPKTPVELKPIVLSRKITKRHISTQVFRKCLTKEVQTNDSKSTSSRFSQTERKKLMTRGSQTEPVSFKAASKCTDAFERMKEIDMEIQALLQEKFKLYNSLESKESCPSTMQSLGMAVLNVTPDTNEEDNSISEDVIVEDFANIPVEELEQIALESVAEENQKAFESEINENEIIGKGARKTTQKHKKKQDSSLSKKKTKNKKNAKTPNISLIEQIITDDRPLEDIISLDELEVPPTKKKSNKAQPLDDIISLDELEVPQTKKKSNKAQPLEDIISLDELEVSSTKKKSHKARPLEDIISLDQSVVRITKKKSHKAQPLKDIISLNQLEVPTTKKKSYKAQSKSKKKVANKVTKPIHRTASYTLKECSVVLKREDLSKLLLKLKTDAKAEPPLVQTDIADELQAETDLIEEAAIEIPQIEIPQIEIPQIEMPQTEIPQIETPCETSEVRPETDIVEEQEEPVINDIQFDMLDVSEDIVIGESCEVKSSEEKGDDPTTQSVVGEIILDNSQSSVEDARGTQSEKTVCKTYDYTTDETLRRDSVTVTGNGDCVLAIECIENNFIAASMDGNVYYFSGDGQLLNTLRGSNHAVTCLTIVKEKNGTTVYTGSLDSRVRYYDLETGLEKGPECNVLSPIQTMNRAWDTIFVGTRTGFVVQFECKNNMLIPVSTVQFSKNAILALRAMKEGPRKVLLVAARTEAVTIKDAQTGLLLRSLEGPNMTVYALLFEDGKIFCGTSSYQIHVFDYASGMHMNTYSGGKGAVCLRSAGGLVFAGCYDGCVYVFKEGRAEPLAQLRGPSNMLRGPYNMLLSLALTGTKLIVGFKDRSLYIWKIPLPILQEMNL